MAGVAGELAAAEWLDPSEDFGYWALNGLEFGEYR
jgi:hypothetical protein